MTTYSLELVFKGDPRADLPAPAHAYIGLKNWSEIEQSPVLTPDCVSEAEVANQISRLHEELDSILTTAKKKFSAYNKTQMAHLSRR